MNAESWVAAASSLGLPMHDGGADDPLDLFDFDAMRRSLRPRAGTAGRAWMHGPWQGREVLIAYAEPFTHTIAQIEPSLSLGLEVVSSPLATAVIGYAPFDDRLSARGFDASRVVELLRPGKQDGMSSADQLVALATRGYQVRVTDSYVALSSPEFDGDGARLYERLARVSRVAERLAKKRTFLTTNAVEEARSAAWAELGALAGVDVDPRRPRLIGRYRDHDVSARIRSAPGGSITEVKVGLSDALGLTLTVARAADLAAAKRGPLAPRDGTVIELADEALGGLVVTVDPVDACRELLSRRGISEKLRHALASCSSLHVADDELELAFDGALSTRADLERALTLACDLDAFTG